MSRLHFDAPRAAWRRRGLAGLAAVLLGASAVWWSMRSPATRPPAPVAPVVPVVAVPLAPPARPAPGATPPVPAGAPATGPATTPVPARPPDRIEVCGRGTMPLDDVERLMAVESAAARRQITASLSQGDARERLLGLLLGAHDAALDALEREPRACAPEDGACSQAVWQRQLAAAQPMLDAAVEMARASRDATLYGMAFVHGCRGGDGEVRGLPSSCARLSAAAWLQRDPGDASPALWAAQQAARRGDAAGVDAALAAALVAPRWSWSGGQLLAPLLSHAGFGSLPAPQRADLLSHVQGLGGSSGLLLSPLLRQHACGPAALADAGRRARCEALVGRVLADSPSLLDFAVAARAAASLGWPAERLRSLEEQRLALVEVRRPPLSVRDAYGCERLQRVVQEHADVARFGETGAARRALEASGRSVSAWAAVARAESARTDAAFAASTPLPRPPR